MAYIGSRKWGAWPPLSLWPLHRNAIFAIDHFRLIPYFCCCYGRKTIKIEGINLGNPKVEKLPNLKATLFYKFSQQ